MSASQLTVILFCLQVFSHVPSDRACYLPGGSLCDVGALLLSAVSACPATRQRQ